MRAELGALRDVLYQHDRSQAERIDQVLGQPDTHVEAFLNSRELWGEKGSVVDLSGAARWWGAQHSVQDAFIALGEWQISHGYVNPGVTHWVEVLVGRRGLQRQSGVERVVQGRRVKPTAVPWSTRDVWLGVLAAAVIVGAAVGLVYLLHALSLRPNADLYVAIVPTLFELLFLVPVWWFAIRKYHASPRALGFVSFGFSVVAIGIAMLFVFYFAEGIYATLLRQFGLGVQADLAPILRRLSTPWPMFATVVLVAPVAEETFFRGFVFAGLRSRYDWRWAAAISAALFSAAHMELTFFLPGFALGFLFAYLYQRSNSIWPGMILHALMNGLAVTLAYWVV